MKIPCTSIHVYRPGDARLQQEQAVREAASMHSVPRLRVFGLHVGPKVEPSPRRNALPRRSDALLELREQVAGWPSDSTIAPAGFEQAAARMQAAFEAAWTKALSQAEPSGRRSAISQLIELSNAALGKHSHTNNLTAACSRFLTSPPVSLIIPHDKHGKILEAARYLNLCDSSTEIPVATMAGKGPFHTIKPLLDRRAAVSAQRLLQANLTRDAEVIDNVRAHKDPSSGSPSAQFLRLMDAAVGMASKPFFQTPGGDVDADKVLGSLRREKGSAADELLDGIEAGIRLGWLDECLGVKRKADHYVR